MKRLNKALIKELIRCKLNAANAVVDSMPPEIAEEIRELGRLIVEGINECCNDIKTKNPSTTNKLNNIPIE